MNEEDRTSVEKLKYLIRIEPNIDQHDKIAMLRILNQEHIIGMIRYDVIRLDSAFNWAKTSDMRLFSRCDIELVYRYGTNASGGYDVSKEIWTQGGF